MDIVCSILGIVDSVRPGQGIMDIKNAGFVNVSLEMSMGCTESELENFGRKEQARSGGKVLISEEPFRLGGYFGKTAGVCRDEGLCFAVARAPHLPRDTKRPDLTDRLVEICREGIRYCGKVGCGTIVVRPVSGGIKGEDEWRINREFYLSLAGAAAENGVRILLENQCRSVNGHLVRGVCADGMKAAEWVDRLNEDVGKENGTEKEIFGFCMDAGVCSLCGQDMREFAVCLGKRLKAVVLRDCDGHRENTLLPFTCADQGHLRTDWLGLIRGLRTAEFDGMLLLDFGSTASAFSPMLRPQLLQLARAVGEYFKWQIEIESNLKKYRSIVLFGAGNMCRNYMKCYGEAFPPLFTCDNNRELWGSVFCGLEVKPPESLRDMPEDCGVFICNIYYREIEKQLREMGVRNIEFFNDEYMPSFYFDRVEREK